MSKPAHVVPHPACMNTRSVFETVRDVLVHQLAVVPQDVTLDAFLIDDLGADSLDRIEIIMHLENELNIEIDDRAIEPDPTVGELVSYLNRFV